MALRRNHYDAAFEAYLRHLRLPYVAVDEAKRASLPDSTLKSLDFIVNPTGRKNLLVDVKGRKFPSAAPEGASSGHLWENWATREEIGSLRLWQQMFGEQFQAVLVFAYDLLEVRWQEKHTHVWQFRQRAYAYYGVLVDDYATVMRQRSPKWETVTLGADDFRRLRRPMEELLLTRDATAGSAGISL